MINYVVGGIVAILVVLAIRSLLDKKKMVVAVAAAAQVAQEIAV